MLALTPTCVIHSQWSEGDGRRARSSGTSVGDAYVRTIAGVSLTFEFLPAHFVNGSPCLGAKCQLSSHLKYMGGTFELAFVIFHNLVRSCGGGTGVAVSACRPKRSGPGPDSDISEPEPVTSRLPRPRCSCAGRLLMAQCIVPGHRPMP